MQKWCLTYLIVAKYLFQRIGMLSALLLGCLAEAGCGMERVPLGFPGGTSLVQASGAFQQQRGVTNAAVAGRSISFVVSQSPQGVVNRSGFIP